MGGSESKPPLDFYDDGGLYYMVSSLLTLAVYIELLQPDLNEWEHKFLNRFAKREFKFLLLFPLVLLLIFGILKVLYYGSPPPYFILNIFIGITILFNPIFGTLYPGATPDEDGNRNIRQEVVLKTAVVGYFCCHISLILFLTGIFGPLNFTLMMQQDFKTLSLSPGILFKVDKNGEFKMINMAHGYLTTTLYKYAPSWCIFMILFYANYMVMTATFRAVLNFCMWVFGRVLSVFVYLYERFFGEALGPNGTRMSVG